MNFSDFITNHGKRVNKQAFVHLLQVACTDKKITYEEFEFLHKKGQKFGLTDPEIDHLIEAERDHHYHQPYSLHEKFEHFYMVAELIVADDVVDENELKILRKFAIEVGFSYDRIDDLIKLVIDGVINNEDEDALYNKFKKVLFNN